MIPEIQSVDRGWIILIVFITEIFKMSKVEFVNCSVSSNADLDVEVEDWLLIEGPFSTGSGSTLNFHSE